MNFEISTIYFLRSQKNPVLLTAMVGKVMQNKPRKAKRLPSVGRWGNDWNQGVLGVDWETCGGSQNCRIPTKTVLDLGEKGRHLTVDLNWPHVIPQLRSFFFSKISETTIEIGSFEACHKKNGWAKNNLKWWDVRIENLYPDYMRFIS